MTRFILAVDPGRDKTGVARVGLDGAILTREIVPTRCLADRLRLVGTDELEIVVVGSGTTSRDAVALLGEVFGPDRVAVVDEKDSTYEARPLYFEDHPPAGVWRLVPLSMQMPPVAIDDYAAVVLARRWIRAHADAAARDGR